MKRILACVLAICLCLSLFPISALADELSPTVSYTVKTTKAYAGLPDMLDYEQIGESKIVVQVPPHLGFYSSTLNVYDKHGKWRGDWTYDKSKYQYDFQGEYENIPGSYIAYSEGIRITLSQLQPGDYFYINLKSVGDDLSPSTKMYRITVLPQHKTPEVEVEKRGDTFLRLRIPQNPMNIGAQHSLRIDGVWTDWKNGLFLEALSPETEYEIRVRFPDTEGYIASEPATLTISTKAAQPLVPEQPLLVKRTDFSLQIKPEEGLEYSIDGGDTWVVSDIFSDLSPDTEYAIIARYRETDEVYFGKNSPPLTIRTKAQQNAPEESPALKSKDTVSISVETIDGMEFSIDGGITWIVEGIFTDLKANTEYEIISRWAETEDKWFSPNSPPLIVRTDAPPPPPAGTVSHEAYIFGYKDGTVRPESYMIRSEAAAVLARVYPQLATAQDPIFSDTTPNAWYYESVQQLGAAGLLAGYRDGAFRPNALITRAEFVSLAMRFVSGDGTGQGTHFSDIAGCWAEESVQKAADLGLIFGCPDGTFRPDAPITRAEVIAIVNRMLNRGVQLTDEQLSSLSLWPDCTNTGSWYFNDIMEASVTHICAEDSVAPEVWE